MKRTCIITFLFSILAYIVNSVPLYSSQTSNIVNLNPKNFDTQILHSRAKNTISFVHFYTRSDGKSNTYKKEIEEMSSEYDGLFKYAAIDCAEFHELCKKQDVKEYPTFKIYPPLPAPVFPYEGEIKSKSIITSLGRFVESKVQEVHSGNFDTFSTENSNLPKAYLFTDKPGVPLIFKVLSVQFDKKIDIGIIRKEETSLIQKFKIKTFPKILINPIGAKKPEIYEGELKYKKIYDFINVYSETFFKVGEDKTRVSEETKVDKPWLKEKLPEFNERSADEVCLKVDGVICVILVNNGKPEKKIADLMSELQNYLSPKIDRGIKYKFAWVNSETQSAFIQETGVEGVPRVMLLNPGKKKKYFVLEEEPKLEKLYEVFDKLASGDLRFKFFKGGFPTLSQ